MDWIAHLAVAYIIGVALRFKKQHMLVLFVGALLPDINKLHIIASFFIHPYTAQNLFLPFHTVIGCAIVAGLLSLKLQPLSLFAKKSFFLLFGGAALHLFLDTLIWPYGTLNTFLWPFWVGEVRTGLVWPDSIYPALLFGGVALALFGLISYRNRKS